MRLGPAALPALPAHVARPRYRRDRLRVGIVHLGIGAFARAHLAVATEAAIHAAGGDTAWGLCGVSLRSAETHDRLAPQDGLYAVALRGPGAPPLQAGREGPGPRAGRGDTNAATHETLQVVGCLRELRVAPDDPAAVLDRIAHADTRIVSLTVTEKGYCHDPASGSLRRDHPDIAHDLARPGAPRSAVGLVVHGLALRRARGLGPLTLLSLDNLPANGASLGRVVLDFAAHVDRALHDWIGARCTFPNSMVDRIVPRTTDADRAAIGAALGAHDAGPVVAEPFFDWAVEDRFAAGRPDWAAGGARFVADAAPWERLKLRMVNGSHSSIAYLALAAGWPTVDAALAYAPLRRHVERLMRDEIEPTLPALPHFDAAAYRDRLMARFANPALAHRTAQIAMDGSQKLPQRLLDTARDRLAAGAPFPRVALGIAAWLHHLRGHDEAGRPYPIDDPLAPELAALHAGAMRAAAACTGPDAAARESARVLVGYAPVFGDLADSPALVEALAPPLCMLREHGVRAALDVLG